MKRTIIISLFIFSIEWVHAQFAENHAIYLSQELNFGNYIGLNADLNYVYNERFSLKIGYNGNIRKPKSQPEDYSSGLIKVMILGLENPYDQIENYQIAFGKIDRLNKSGTIRINFLVGIGYTIIREPENWQKIDDGSFFFENYTWNYKRNNAASLIINPKIEFPFTSVFGLTVSPMLEINKYRVYYGVGIGTMLGLLRKRKTKPN
ncbi:hypothetical protein [Mariniphaga sp.]|uniref:hypothetical protein n=1 Tax=Mariniphaga sp. TaxID=1954475 RepID=UPI0035643516